MSNTIKIQVRFSDVDMMGHINNAIYLNYFETARMHFLNAELGSKWNWVQNGIVLRKNEIEYLEPVFLTDVIEIEVRPETIGNTSFTLIYILRVGDKIKCKGESRLVCYNYNEKTAVQVYPEFKKAFERYIK
jgi:acyl-CoA thioester hydrolase